MGDIFPKGNAMKIPALITAAALTCGSAFAQYGSTAERDAPANSKPSAAAPADSQPAGSGEGIMAKTKRALQSLGDKIRSVGNKSSDADKTAGKDATRSMGAAGSDSADSARRARMDEAYANSKKAKPQDK